MIGKNNTYKVLKLFFKYPTTNFYLRGIARQTGLSLPAVIAHVKLLEKNRIVKIEKGDLYNRYKANLESDRYRLYKKIDTIQFIEENVLPVLIKEVSAYSATVLYGQAARGRDIEGGEVNLFVVGEKSEIHTSRWEQELNRKITFLFMDKRTVRDLKWVGREHLNNLVNGIILHGRLEVA